MKFIITGPALKTKYLNSYTVECKAMFGDADGDGMVKVEGFTLGDEDLLEEFIQLCEKMKKAYPSGRGGNDTYNFIEGFDKWFDIDNISYEEYEKLPSKLKELSTEWLRDPQSFGEYQASFEDYKVYYYNQLGVKYNVEVVI